MPDVYQGWTKSMKDFKASIDKELDEMRRCKAEMQQVKQEITKQMESGHYVRDNDRIIISAPEIVIGNVLKDGSLIPNEPSTVIIRSNTIRQEGVGTTFGTGSIINKATEIRNICVDAGIDGFENVVSEDSLFTVQAQGIALQSESTDGTFADVASAKKGEINLQADNHITVSALAPLGYRKVQVVDAIEQQEKIKKEYEKATNSKMNQIENCTKTLNLCYEEGINLFNGQVNGMKEGFKAAPRLLDIENLQKIMKQKQEALYQLILEFQENAAKTAEANRQIKTLKAEKEKIEKTQENVRNHKSTNAAIDIFAENTNIQSVDANYEICKSEGAGLDITAKNVGISAIDHNKGLIYDSNFSVNTHHVKLSTANRKFNGETLDLPAEGDVKITSRDIVLESVDKVYDDKKATPGASEDTLLAEKQLAKSGSIKLRAKNINVRSQTTEGEPEGEFNVNSKIVKMGALYQDEETKELVVAKDSLIDLNYAGASITSSDWLALNSQKSTLLAAKESLEIQQDEDKAVIQLADSKTILKSDEAQIMGTTTLTGKTTFKADAALETASIKKLTVSDAIKTPNSNEGNVGTPAPAADETLELLVKLTELEEKIKEISDKSDQVKKDEEEQVKKEEEDAKQEASKPEAEPPAPAGV